MVNYVNIFEVKNRENICKTEGTLQAPLDERGALCYPCYKQKFGTCSQEWEKLHKKTFKKLLRFAKKITYMYIEVKKSNEIHLLKSKKGIIRCNNQNLVEKFPLLFSIF